MTTTSCPGPDTVAKDRGTHIYIHVRSCVLLSLTSNDLFMPPLLQMAAIAPVAVVEKDDDKKAVNANAIVPVHIVAPSTFWMAKKSAELNTIGIAA